MGTPDELGWHSPPEHSRLPPAPPNGASASAVALAVEVSPSTIGSTVYSFSLSLTVVEGSVLR